MRLMNQSKIQQSIILHAGGPKTGTSSIQRTFNPKNFSINGCDLKNIPFKMLTRRLSAEDFSAECNQGRAFKHIWGNSIDLVMVDEWRNDLLSQITRETNHKNISYVFSAERAGAPKIDLLKSKQLAEFLCTIGRVNEVLYYARPLKSLYLALGLQQIKAFAIRPKHRKLFAINENISITHITDKYRYFKDLYPDAKINFRVFQRRCLKNSDIRLDFAEQLSTSKEMLDKIRLELNKTPNSNKSIDLPVLKILTKLYEDFNVQENTRVSSLFLQFLSLGNWSGQPCTLLDIYTEEQVNIIKTRSQEEIEHLNNIFKVGSIKWLGEFTERFTQSLILEEEHLAQDNYKREELSYKFKLTLSQQILLKQALKIFKECICDSSREFRIIESTLEKPMNYEHPAVEVFEAVYKAGIKLSITKAH